MSARIVNNRITCAQLDSIRFRGVNIGPGNRKIELTTGFIKSASRFARNLVVAFISLVKDLDKRKCAPFAKFIGLATLVRSVTVSTPYNFG